MTSKFRYITRSDDRIVDPEEINLTRVKPEELHAGDTPEEAAKTFMKILMGEGTDGQNNVVISNAAFALKCYFPEKSFEECLFDAKESLLGKKAYNVFKN